MGLLVVGFGMGMVGWRPLRPEVALAGALMAGLVGSVCGLAMLGRGSWGHGLAMVTGCVGFALAVMVWAGRH
ncbi:MAG: hypothetical protein SNJ84_02655 [Verrucomicrobiia bacterium]